MSRRMWTREDLERIERADQSVGEFADEFDVATATIYSLRKKIGDLGIDVILQKQETRHKTYVAGGAGRPETLADQLGKVQRITIALGGRGDMYQYGVTIPSRIGEAFVHAWGRNVRFEPTQDGLLIRPVITVLPDTLPDWISDNGANAGEAEGQA